jgi:hypothetical protein
MTLMKRRVRVVAVPGEVQLWVVCAALLVPSAIALPLRATLLGLRITRRWRWSAPCDAHCDFGCGGVCQLSPV